MGSSTGATPAPKAGADLGQGAVEVGPFPVELVDDDHPGQAEPGRGPPGVLGLGLHAVGGADHHHGKVGTGQGGQHFGGEVGVAGRVEQVDLHPVHGEGCEGGGDRTAAGRSPRARSHRPWCLFQPNLCGRWRRSRPGAPRPRSSCRRRDGRQERHSGLRSGRVAPGPSVRAAMASRPGCSEELSASPLSAWASSPCAAAGPRSRRGFPAGLEEVRIGKARRRVPATS